jgi:hypothetical protein
VRFLKFLNDFVHSEQLKDFSPAAGSISLKLCFS